MKKLALLTFMIACVAFVFVSCAGGGAGGEVIVIDDTDPTVVKDGSTLAPNSVVKFAWKDANGNPVTCNYVLTRNGEVVEEQDGVTEVVTAVTDEGHYTATFIPVSASGSRTVKTVRFTVNRMYEELYNSNHGLFFKEDVSQLFAAFNAQGQETAEIAFYRLNQKVIEGTDEVINIRVM